MQEGRQCRRHGHHRNTHRTRRHTRHLHTLLIHIQCINRALSHRRWWHPSTIAATSRSIAQPWTVSPARRTSIIPPIPTRTTLAHSTRRTTPTLTTTPNDRPFQEHRLHSRAAPLSRLLHLNSATRRRPNCRSQQRPPRLLTVVLQESSAHNSHMAILPHVTISTTRPRPSMTVEHLIHLRRIR